MTTLVTGDGLVSLALTSIDSRAVSYSSRDGANPSQLVITFGDHTPGEIQPTAVPSVQPTNTLEPTSTLPEPATLTPTALPYLPHADAQS